jgi:hypothetical protein
MRLHWKGAKELVLWDRRELSGAEGENEPPKEAGAVDPPGAPYIGSRGDKVNPTIHYTCTLLTIADVTTRVLSPGHGMVYDMSCLYLERHPCLMDLVPLYVGLVIVLILLLMIRLLAVDRVC